MKPGKKKFVRMTLEELDRYGWKPPNQSNRLNCQEGTSLEESRVNSREIISSQDTPRNTENIDTSPPVALWRMVSPLIDALKLTNSH